MTRRSVPVGEGDALDSLGVINSRLGVKRGQQRNVLIGFLLLLKPSELELQKRKLISWRTGRKKG
jgi:hypothetical protein